jgi:hypothetical protein
MLGDNATIEDAASHPLIPQSTVTFNVVVTLKK